MSTIYARSTLLFVYMFVFQYYFHIYFYFGIHHLDYLYLRFVLLLASSACRLSFDGMNLVFLMFIYDLSLAEIKDIMPCDIHFIICVPVYCTRRSEMHLWEPAIRSLHIQL